MDKIKNNLCMKKLIVLLGILLITSGVNVLTAQTIGSTKTEE